MMLSLEQAAKHCGYSVKGFRKVIDRSRSAAQGKRVAGPVIRFAQDKPYSRIKVKQEWCEEFVDRMTVNPFAQPTARPERRPNARKDRQVVAAGRHTENKWLRMTS